MESVPFLQSDMTWLAFKLQIPFLFFHTVVLREKSVHCMLESRSAKKLTSDVDACVPSFSCVLQPQGK